MKKIESQNMGEVVLYQPDERTQLEVRLEDETVWLTQQQMSELFDVKEHTITYHIKEIYKSQELDAVSTARKIRVVRKEGNRQVNRQLDFYNLDMILSVGYRVNSVRGIMFRRWSSGVLKQYLLRGYAVHEQIQQLENRIDNRFVALQHPAPYIPAIQSSSRQIWRSTTSNILQYSTSSYPSASMTVI